MRPTRRSKTCVRPVVRPLIATLLVASLGTLTACAPSGTDTEESAPQPVTNSELQITLTRVPAGFRVALNEGASLVLEHTDPEDPATLSFVVGPPQNAGVNLQAQVWAEKDRIEGMPGGDYKGQNELAGAAVGTVYTSRGRFLGEDDQPVEEYRALIVHPTRNRLLTLDYEYPPTERTGERLQELMAAIEAIDVAGEDSGDEEQ